MIITDMYTALKNANVCVYLAAQPQGIVTQNRVVLTDSGVIEAGKTVGKHLFVVSCYVPFARSTDIITLMASVRTALRSVASVKPTGITTDGDVLDDIKAYTVSMEYCAMCAL